MKNLLDTSQRVLGLSMAALLNKKIDPKQANLLSSMANDFLNLFNLDLKLRNASGRGLRFEGSPPTLESVQRSLGDGDYSQALDQAKLLRERMKPILKNAREQVSAAKR